MALTWGVFVPHGGANELDGMTPAEAWARARDFAEAADDLGYDHLWTSDHLMASGGDRTGPYFEAFTFLSALTQVTSRARLGQLVTCAPYRNAALLAKEAANVDIFSGGRLILGLGGGWDQGEFEAFGYGFPSAGQRYRAFAETLQAVRLLWSQEKVDFDGEFVRLNGASCSPKPVSDPPIWTGTHGPRGLEMAARYADVANFNQGLESFTRLSALVDQTCARVGRTIEKSVFRLADVSGGRALDKMLADAGAPPEAGEALRADHFIGEVDEVVAKVQAFVNAGAQHVVIMALDAATSMATTQTFLEEVAPEIRQP